jgi:prepilin-type processing-associated H-X9-DG protein
MRSFPLNLTMLTNRRRSIIDFPASYHNGACGFSFCDGHSEIHKWNGSKIKGPVHYNGNLQLNVSADDSWQDVWWMAHNATVHK